MTAPLAARAAVGRARRARHGSMALAFVATVAGRWFVARRGLVSGILDRGQRHRAADLPAAAGPRRRAARLAGGVADDQRRARCRGAVGAAAPARPARGRGRAALRRHRRTSPRRRAPARRGRRSSRVLRAPPASGTFWLLAGGFFVCGATTNGLVGTHFMPAAHDHGMPVTTAAACSRWSGSSTSSARSPRAGSPTGSTRGCCSAGLLRPARPVAARCSGRCSAPTSTASMLVVRHLLRTGLGRHRAADLALCREASEPRAPIVFGWVFASHQLGARVCRARSPASPATRWAATTRPGTAGRCCACWARCCRCRSGGTARSPSSRPPPRPPGSALAVVGKPRSGCLPP